MAGRRLTVVRFEEVKRLLAVGRSVREIARALKCSRDTVRGVRDGALASPDHPKEIPDPLWMAAVDWSAVLRDLGDGHPLKYIAEERARGLTTYSNFWKQFYRKFPEYREASVTLREFSPGERAEVDYAGGKVEWVDLKTGEIREAVVFVAALCYSQLFFAWASEDMKSRNWLASHRRMYETFGGVPAVTAPDCLKQGVLKCHIYDPDLNPAYAELAAGYGTAIVPARPRRPKDKAIVEGAVRIIMRLLRWRYRRRTFTSLSEINRALAEVVAEINEKPHSKWRVSRLERFEKTERPTLRPLPASAPEGAEWKKAKLHADCYVSVEGAYYSAPHIHRGKELRVKLTETQVEIFLNLERLTIHPRDRAKSGNRVKRPEHFPENSKAYYEATPQNLLSQARFIHADLHALVVELFNDDVYGNIRRVQGLVRVAVKEMNKAGRDTAMPRIERAIAQMRRFNQHRVAYFEDCLKQERRRAVVTPERQIARLPDNPMLRYTGARNQQERQ